MKNKKSIKNVSRKNFKNPHRVDGIATLIASLLVLFTSLLDPRVSLVLAIAFLILYSLFKIFVDKR